MPSLHDYCDYRHISEEITAAVFKSGKSLRLPQVNRYTIPQHRSSAEETVFNIISTGQWNSKLSLGIPGIVIRDFITIAKQRIQNIAGQGHLETYKP